MTNNKIDKIIKVLDKDIKYYTRNKIFSIDFHETIRLKNDLINRKLSVEEIERICEWLC